MLCELSLRFPDEHHVHVRFEGVDSGACSFVNPLTRKDLQDLQWYLEVYGAHSLGDPDDIEAARIAGRLPEWGTLLFAAVFAESAAARLFDRFREQQDGPRLLTITAEQPSLLALPWELLHGLQGAAGPRISIRRRVAGITEGRKPYPIEIKDHLHLLFVVSRPEGAAFLDPRADAGAVLDALEEHAPGCVTWELLRPPTLDALRERLGDATRPPVDVLHFDGHGLFDDHANIGYLLFETADRRVDFVSAERLGESLHRHRVSLLILSACQSAKEADEEEDEEDAAPDRPMGSVAARLAAAGIPAVLAMTHSVLVPTTRQLFGVLYKDLARHLGIGESLDNARRHLREHPERYEVQRGPDRVWLRLQDWLVPALYQSGEDVPLLRAAPEEATPPPPPPRTNLKTVPEAGFFGRRRELWEIERGFSSQARRIALTGFGGQGKTALAQEAGRWLLRTRLFEAAVFVDYSRIQAADAIAVAVSNIGSVLGESLLDEEAAREALARTATLVILDNLEALEPGPLRELLDAAVSWSTAGRSRVLLTTRQPDFVHAEYSVEGTFIHRRISLAGLGSRRSPDDALEWFAELTKLPPAPDIKESPIRGELIDLFEKVRFHPLSIRVLVQQLKTRRPAELGERLEQLLATRSEAAAFGDRDEVLPELVASIQLSLDRLDATVRFVLPRLGVFQGGAFEDDLLAITEIQEGEWVFLRRQLKAAALVKAESLPGFLVPFLRFHPTLAPMLWAQLNPEEQARLSTAHRGRYCRVANDLYHEDDRQPQEARAIARLDLPNLLHAVHAAFASGDPEAGDFADSIIKFLKYFGLRREASVLVDLAQSTSAEEGSHAWCVAQSAHGEWLMEQGCLGEAIIVLENVLAKFGEEPTYDKALALFRVGRCYMASGPLGRAESTHRGVLRVLADLEVSAHANRLTGAALVDMATVLMRQGRYREARQAFEGSVEIANELGDLRGRGISIFQLGTLAMLEGKLREAYEKYDAALVIALQLREPAMEAAIRHQLGLISQKSGRWADAELHYRKAAQIKEENGLIGGPNGAATTWHQLALVSERAGNAAMAENWYKKSIEAWRGLDASIELCGALANMAGLLAKQPARLAEAKELAEESLNIRRALDPRISEIWSSYSVLADIADKEARPAEALQYQRLAREAKRAFAGTRHEIRRHLPLIAAVVMAVNQESFRARFEETLSRLEQRGAQTLVAAIRKLLAGERDTNALGTDLNVDGAMIIETILRALEDPSTLDDLLGDPELA